MEFKSIGDGSLISFVLMFPVLQVFLQRLAVAYRNHYEALWQQEAAALEQSGLMDQARKSASRQPCPPQDVLRRLLLERRAFHLQVGGLHWLWVSTPVTRTPVCEIARLKKKKLN